VCENFVGHGIFAIYFLNGKKKVKVKVKVKVNVKLSVYFFN
jgi:antitoxin component YwqK of YwqJK toxin-antitoxin module